MAGREEHDEDDDILAVTVVVGGLGLWAQGQTGGRQQPSQAASHPEQEVDLPLAVRGHAAGGLQPRDVVGNHVDLDDP